MRRGRALVDATMVLRTRLLARTAPPGRLDHERVLPGPPPPPALAAAVVRWAPDITEPAFTRASRLARGLAEAGGGPRLSTTTERALAGILTGRRGVCSDKSQVLTGLCLAAGIGVREWGLRDRHDRTVGHALCEVWSPEHGRWLLLDPGRGVAAAGPDGEPVGVREVADAVAGGRRGAARLVPLGEAPIEAEGALPTDDLLLHPDRVWFLLAGYQPLRADRILRHCPPLPFVAAHALTLLVGAHPTYLVYEPRPRRDEAQVL